MTRFKFLMAAAVVLFGAGAASAQPTGAGNYPERTVKIIVSTAPGGGVDTVTRLVAEQLTHILGQTFVIENRGGGGGNIGADAVFNATPDGYTLLSSQPAPITTNIALYKKLSFEPEKLVPVAILTSIPNVLLVKNDFPAKTAQEFMAYVKANPSKLNFASQGPGTTSHLTAELFNKLAGTKMTHVPYKGTGPALNDLVAGHVDLIFMQLESAIKLAQGGKARILAVTTEKRIAALPDVPTMGEVGLKDLISDTWNAISAPPNTPAPIAAKLNAAINQALKSPDLQDKFKKLHLEAVGGTPEHMADVVRSDTKRWGEVIREANIPKI